MKYKILYTRFQASQRVVTVLDTRKGRLIHFTLDELDKDELDQDLEDTINLNIEKIKTGYWDYTL